MGSPTPTPLKIFLYCVQTNFPRNGDVMGYALAEDGRGIGSHLSSNEGFARHDMGLTSDWQHDTYQAASFPFGYALEWVSDLEAHVGFNAAFALNQAIALAEGSTPDAPTENK